MKITVGGKPDEPAPIPFNPLWDLSPYKETVLGNQFSAEQVRVELGGL